MNDSRLSLYQSIPLGIGSIIGSGVLFLPSITYKVSGSDVLVSWLLTILLCYPGMFFFNEMIKKLNPGNSSLSGMIELGLGKELGKSVPVILLGTVVFGMPSAAIIGGSYFSEAFQLPYLKPLVAYFLIVIAILINLKGLRTSSIITLIIAALLVVVSVYLIVKTSQPLESYRILKPTFNVNNIFSGAVLSFWAFAGFENLTFLYDRFKNPRRDLLITISVSITVCSALYLGLVANFAVLIPYFEVEQTTGLLQIAKYANQPGLGYVIAIFAVTCVLVNLISWTGGIVQLIVQAGKMGVLSPLVAINEKRATYSLGAVFILSLSFGLLSADMFDRILTIVSTNFLVLYFLAVLSYVIISKNILKKIWGAVICLGLLAAMSSSSYLLFYPFVLFLITFLNSRELTDIGK